MNRADLVRLLAQVNADKADVQNQVADLQGRLLALTKAADGLQALLDMTPAPREWAFVSDSDAGHAVAEVAQASEEERALTAEGHSGWTPRGRQAARLILESDTSKFWSVRQVWDEQVKRGWAEPRRRGAKGNPPARVALQRLHDHYPEHVQVITAPVLAYKWVPGPSSSPNGTGASHAEEDRGEP
jgi:hypothetical protein